MAKQKTDRRVRKTRALLLQGLMKLMEEKEIKDISVKELAEYADINRGTFYLHYSDIYDMLDKIEAELFEEFNQILDRNFRDMQLVFSPYAVLEEIFIFLETNRETVRVMIGPHGDLAFVNRLRELVKNRIHHIMEAQMPAGENFEYYYSFLVSGCIGVIETWLNTPSPCPPEEMALLCGHMIIKELTF